MWGFDTIQPRAGGAVFFPPNSPDGKNDRVNVDGWWNIHVWFHLRWGNRWRSIFCSGQISLCACACCSARTDLSVWIYVNTLEKVGKHPLAPVRAFSTNE